MEIFPGQKVVTTHDDPELPEGSVGIVQAVHPDPIDGINVRFDAGMFNIVASELAATEK
jgi:cell shape-determining protein MreC